MTDESRERVDALLKRLNIEYPVCGFGIGAGWIPVVERALEKMVAAGWDRNLCQVKEKFGGLRLYIGEATDDIHAIVEQAERECDLTCELCGTTDKVATLPSPRWILTLCAPCRSARGAE